ncbi:Alpha/beta hydrolase-1 [Corchorus capsularis]|uniref:Alpha/beta hydrolase-1 n=1 Tax=Corchorus capsularis TaxID=210143 RepID=A0A1R3IWW3_COCAP|nr:Alpha/beta hydrolase-1 [Corchorus capsularis]
MHPFKLSKCFSFTASRDWFYKQSFSNAGLRSVATDLGEGTVMHCWVPKIQNTARPNLLLLHGFGANAMWQYGEHLRHFTPRFNVYVPDLVFFGESYTTRTDRSESFQAQCIMKMMEKHGALRMNLVGISYGGFVGYSMAAQFPDRLDKLVLCCTGVCLEEKDLEEGFFHVADLDEAISILLPQSPEKLRELMSFSFVKPQARWVPSYFLTDFIDVMCTDYLEEKKELIQAILKNRKFSNLPKISQRTLIVWGEEDHIFPLELGHRLKRHVGESAELKVIKNAGHALNIEKPKEFIKHLKSFLFDSDSCPPSQSTYSGLLFRYWYEYKASFTKQH